MVLSQVRVGGSLRGRLPRVCVVRFRKQAWLSTQLLRSWRLLKMKLLSFDFTAIFLSLYNACFAPNEASYLLSS